MTAAAAVFHSFGHCDPDRLITSWSRVATRIPHDGIVLVAFAQKPTESIGVLLVEHLLRVFVDVPRFGGNQGHDQPQLVGPVDNVVHVLEKRLIGFRRVAVDKGRLPE